MRIRAVTPIPVTYRMEREPLSYCYVRVESDDGFAGFGEACDSFGCTYAGVVAKVIEDAFAPLLVGQDLVAVEPLAERLRLFTRRRLGDQWVAVQARSALEIALWDLLGRATGQSVSSILGRVYELAEQFVDEWDNKAFDPDYDAQPLEHFAPMVGEAFSRPPRRAE